ncbi:MULTISPECIES: nicotinamide riboside transporter PnuC [unclassified Arenibacter]|uniref:nicotinamide riboside transporter PnuC n=1 Tax=unclassified Arenibacter TaxID=2615047 RepID=UPI000E35548E|nr:MULTISPECIES: nicotinamide riboside transporter PnuC [unclassified Arenibacter]MCM4164487.1 nicotinamide riboside transporter PnuC [Arenibacter sp. A80]RFT55576.1 nicotinamide riboside transporter PnuC [Arenibacter sp. P308M17]
MENFFTQLTYLQIIGTALGVAQVLLARNNNIHNYLFGIASILIGIWVLYQTKLYADIVLHLYYLFMSIYGWLFWKYGRQKKETPITYSDRSEQIMAIAIVIACFALMLYWLGHFTNSDVPVWDAAVSAFAWAGMWLMAKRKMENWIYLNISNLIAIPLFVYKELYVYAGLTIFLFVVGTSGYFKWRKLILENNNGQTAQA